MGSVGTVGWWSGGGWCHRNSRAGSLAAIVMSRMLNSNLMACSSTHYSGGPPQALKQAVRVGTAEAPQQATQITNHTTRTKQRSLHELAHRIDGRVLHAARSSRQLHCQHVHARRQAVLPAEIHAGAGAGGREADEGEAGRDGRPRCCARRGGAGAATGGPHVGAASAAAWGPHMGAAGGRGGRHGRGSEHAVGGDGAARGCARKAAGGARRGPGEAASCAGWAREAATGAGRCAGEAAARRGGGVARGAACGGSGGAAAAGGRGGVPQQPGSGGGAGHGCSGRWCAAGGLWGPRLRALRRKQRWAAGGAAGRPRQFAKRNTSLGNEDSLPVQGMACMGRSARGSPQPPGPLVALAPIQRSHTVIPVSAPQRSNNHGERGPWRPQGRVQACRRTQQSGGP